MNGSILKRNKSLSLVRILISWQLVLRIVLRNPRSLSCFSTSSKLKLYLFYEEVFFSSIFQGMVFLFPHFFSGACCIHLVTCYFSFLFSEDIEVSEGVRSVLNLLSKLNTNIDVIPPVDMQVGSNSQGCIKLPLT